MMHTSGTIESDETVSVQLPKWAEPNPAMAIHLEVQRGHRTSLDVYMSWEKAHEIIQALTAALQEVGRAA